VPHLHPPVHPRRIGVIVDPLGSLIGWAAPLGLAGLLLIGAMERLIPVLPSYGLLVAIGIGAADGLWSVPLAILALTLGSTAGCLAWYALAVALGESRSHRFLRWNTRIFGLSPDRIARWIEGYRRNQVPIAFGAQLVPTVRLLTPVIAGLLRADARAFLLASAAGIVAWNTLFVGLGFLAARTASDVNASVLALKLLAGLIVAEALAALAWRHLRQGTAGRSSIHP
jgi:membrane protein DedA with SNARE-associated domain